MEMKKLIHLFLIISLFFSCSSKLEKIERKIEDGTEVIVNHIEPYRIKGEPVTFSLEKEISIDAEDEELSEKGLAAIRYFDVDSKGNIYVLSPRSKEYLVFKFDKKGNFIKPLVRKGQGPGELPRASYISVGPQDELAIADSGSRKLCIFNKDGVLIREKTFKDRNIMGAYLLEDGRYIFAIHEYPDQVNEFQTQYYMSLFSDEFDEIKEIDRIQIPHPLFHEKYKGIYHTFFASLSNQKFFLAFQDRGYEIYVYDLVGNLVRKIRKEYTPVPVSAAYKTKYLLGFSGRRRAPLRKKIYFPDHMPPFHSFFTDDEGRVFVMSYEKGENPGEYMYDIFNSDGLFIGRKSLRIYNDHQGLYAKIKNGRLYCLNEKKSFYKELVVYKLHWK